MVGVGKCTTIFGIVRARTLSLADLQNMFARRAHLASHIYWQIEDESMISKRYDGPPISFFDVDQ